MTCLWSVLDQSDQRDELGATYGSEVWLAEQTRTQGQPAYKFRVDSDRLRALKREVSLSRVLRGGVDEHGMFVYTVEVDSQRRVALRLAPVAPFEMPLRTPRDVGEATVVVEERALIAGNCSCIAGIPSIHGHSEEGHPRGRP